MLDHLGHVRLRSYYVATRASNAHALGRVEEALRDVDVQIAEERRGPGHGATRDLAWLLMVRGDALMALDRDGEAARAYEDAAFAAGDYALDVDYARALQAVALVGAGRLGDARAALPARGDGAASPATTMALAAAARLAAAEGRDDDALRGYARALAEADAAALRPVHVHYQLRERRDRVRLLGWRALALQATDPDAAREGLRAAATEGRARLGDAHPVVREIDAALAAAEGHVARR